MKTGNTSLETRNQKNKKNIRRACSNMLNETCAEKNKARPLPPGITRQAQMELDSAAAKHPHQGQGAQPQNFVVVASLVLHATRNT